MSSKKYVVEVDSDNAEALELIAVLGKKALVTRRPNWDDYLKCHCPACGNTTRIMRKCQDLKMLVPTFEESPGFVGLDWDEWESQPDVGDTEPQYVCEACGYVLFTGITEIDEWLKEHPTKKEE